MNPKQCIKELKMFGYEVNDRLENFIETNLKRVIDFMNRMMDKLQ